MAVLQLYLNMSSNQTGEVVKLLTMITLITTPMMMIGTWYGMNFATMPELSNAHGYLIASVIMVLSTGSTIGISNGKNGSDDLVAILMERCHGRL